MKKPNLFSLGNFIGNAGKLLDFKLECDALTDEDLETIAYLIAKRHKFWMVQGIPRGGERIANFLHKYSKAQEDTLPFLIVDDVLTTGGSIERGREHVIQTIGKGDRSLKIQGVVIFARDTMECPLWVDPLFKMWR